MFWSTLKPNFTVLAPMEDVTDTVFRQIILKCGRPDVFFTEFTNVEGIISPGFEKVSQRLKYLAIEKPIIAQIWGLKPENFEKAAKLIVDMGYDGIDVNMGCPEKSVVKQGACSALIKNPTLAREIIEATKRGAGGLDVSVKTRIGFNTIITEDWLSFLLEQNIAALTVHGRTVKELSEVPAHWNEIGKAVQLRNKISPQTKIIGNGDIKSIEEASQMHETYKVDGVMIGRGIFADPWLFAQDRKVKSKSERLDVLLAHTKLYVETWGTGKNFDVLKKFYKIYVSGFDGASQLRVKLMACKNLSDVESVVNAEI